MTVRMPDGMVQQIRYAGNVPPRIVFVPAAQAVASPFAMMQRISAEMDRQMAMMMQVFSPMMAMPSASAPITAAFGNVPAGAGVCMHSISVTYTGDGQKPQVVSQTSGNCGPAAPASSVSAPVVSPERPKPAVPTILVKDDQPMGQPAYRALVVPAADLRG